MYAYSIQYSHMYMTRQHIRICPCYVFVLSYTRIHYYLMRALIPTLIHTPLSYRLAEEVDRRTDVRGKGMQGFYANLLTKNIAMGGDVSTSAVSAYTAGSERQHVLVYGKGESDAKGQNYHEDTAVAANSSSSSSSIKEQQQALTLATTSVIVGSKRPLEPYIDREDDRSHTIPLLPTTTTTTTHSTITAVEHADKRALPAGSPPVEGKEKAVLSARERYLARKNAATVTHATSEEEDS